MYFPLEHPRGIPPENSALEVPDFQAISRFLGNPGKVTGSIKLGT
jgi:hypothetical protein